MAYTGFQRSELNIGYLRGAYIMDDLNRIKHAQSDKNTPYHCSQIPTIVHELSQSILVIHAYVCGCSERLKNSNLSPEDGIKPAELLRNADHSMYVVKKLGSNLFNFYNS